MEKHELRKDYVYLLMAIPAFMTYATCMNLQRYLKEAASIPSEKFQAAYGSMFIGLLIFRIGHNIIFAPFYPFSRLIIGYAFCMATQVLQIVAQLVEFDPRKNNVWIAYLNYICGGIGIGCFNPNMLAVFSTISQSARYYGVLGIIVGINVISIGSFFTFGLLGGLMPQKYIAVMIFAFTLAMCVIAVALLFAVVPYRQMAGQNAQILKLSYMFSALRHSKAWLKPLIPGIITLAGNIFAVQEFFPGITLYTINNDRSIALFGIYLKTEYFRTLYSIIAFLANLGARIAFERIPYIFPPLFLYLDLFGALFIISGIPELMLLGVLILELASGGSFVQITKFIRDVAGRTDWNVFAFSFSLFISDFGSLAAGQSQQSLVKAICEGMRSQMSSWDVCPYYF